MGSLRMMAALGVTAALLFAHTDMTPSPEEQVQMIVTVEARQGKQVPVLKQGDVMVFQNKQKLFVTSVVPAKDDCAALELMILIDDASGTNLGTQLNDLKRFIQNQPSETSIGVAYMRNGTIALAQGLTADHAAAAKALRLALGSPGTMPSPFLSLSDVIQQWPPSSARHEVILISSGIDPLGGGVADPYLYTAIEHAQRAGVVVYAIYTPAAGHGGHSFWRLEWGQNHLAQIAEETGGESYMLGFEPPVAFEPYLADIAAHLSHQYIVNFLIAPRAKAGFQQVRLTTEVPNAELVHAGRVYVPASR
jgi:hypothetical protein